MGVFYTMSGSVKVRPCPEVEEIVRRFNAESGKELTASYYPETDEVEFEGGTHCSYNTTSTLDNIAKELSPYATEAAQIVTTCDDEEEMIYVGPPEMEAATVSKTVLAEITSRLEYLTPADKASLKSML